MCGISCLVNFRDNSDLQLNIKNMMRSLNHRGPDYSNYYLYKNVGIAHNRLSIIDLTDKARQPFKSKDVATTPVVIVGLDIAGLVNKFAIVASFKPEALVSCIKILSPVAGAPP